MIELKVKILKSFKDKVIGLLGAKSAYPVLIKTRFGIHTFGMKFPIDVLVLSKNNEVVKTRENLRPNMIFLWPPFFDTVLELPAGEIKKNKIKIRDMIKVMSAK